MRALRALVERRRLIEGLSGGGEIGDPEEVVQLYEKLAQYYVHQRIHQNCGFRERASRSVAEPECSAVSRFVFDFGLAE